MTGFATSTAEITLPNEETVILSLNMKSLNSRFFEASCKLPSLLSNLEIPIQKMLKKKLHRGHVFLHIKVVNSEILKEAVTPSIHTINNYLNAINIIQKEFNLTDQVTLDQILRLPNALQTNESQLDKTTEQSILDLVLQLAESLSETQKKEGSMLEKDIREQLELMRNKTSIIKNLSLDSIELKKNELKKILSSLTIFDQAEGEKSDEQCLLETKKTTLLYEIEKIDINEEIVRFNSHLKSITDQLSAQQATKGKKLDFTIQELNREINTIASKCSNVEISSLVIDIKSELEKAREQAQNII